MAEIPANFTTYSYIFRRLVDRGIDEAHYLCCLNTIVEDFENAKHELIPKQQRVEREARLARDKTEEIPREVEHWLDKADNLINEDTETRKSCICRMFPNCIWRYRRGKELERKKQDINSLIISCNGIFNFSPLPEITGVEYYSSKNFVQFESRNSMYEQLLKALEDKDHYVIGLHGMSGTGKTTLAKEVGKLLKERKVFDHVIIVAVSNTPVVKNIQDQIASPLDLKLGDENELNRAKKLRMRLNNDEKILIVLDNVCNELKLEEIGISPGDEHKSCHVLLTTPDPEVCRSMKCQQTFVLKCLSDSDAWVLFKRSAGLNQKSSKTKKDKGKKIAKLCRGLPVAIVATARILKDKEEKEWDMTLKSLEGIGGNGGADPLEVYWQISYDYLASQAKELLLLCSVFPENYEIPVEDLATFGIGLGLCEEVICARDTVHKFLKTLIDARLLSRVKEGKFVKMHDSVRVAAHYIAKKTIQVVMDPQSLKALQEDASVRRKLKYLYCHSINDLPERLGCPKIEILILEWGSQLKFVTLPDTFFEGMRDLKVWVLSSPGTLILPKSVESLNNLKTLSLRYLKLDDLLALEKLESLESLQLKYCSSNELPNGIVKLKKLKLLRMEDCSLQKNPFEVISKLSQLEELYFMGNDVSEVGIEDISTLSLQRYHIEFNKTNSLQSSVNDSISRALSIACFDGSPSNATIKKFVQRAEILHMYQLQGDWPNIIPDHTEVIGEMKDLTELKLKSCPEIMFLIDATFLYSPQETPFPNIAKLSLEDMDNLKGLCDSLPLEDMHNSKGLCDSLPPPNLFKSLKELVIQQCLLLNSRLFPRNLKLCALKILRVSECPKLTSLSTLSTARSLDLLEVLYIKGCKALEYIIKEESDEGNENEIVKDHDVFPGLKILTIDGCQQLKHLFSVCSNPGNLNLCRLKILRVKECPTLTSLLTLSTAINLDSLEELEITGCQALQYIIKEESGKGKEKEIVEHDDVQGRYSLLFQKFRRVVISSCQQLKQILTVGSSKRRLMKHTSPMELQAVDGLQNQPFNTTRCLFFQLMNLRHIKKMRLVQCELKLTSLFDLSIVPTMSLEELTINECHGLKHIITDEKDSESHMNNGSVLKNLKYLRINYCSQLIYVIGKYRSQLSALKVFPKLEELHLKDLPHIKSIGQNNDQPRWSALRKLDLIECPQFSITIIGDCKDFGADMKLLNTFDGFRAINSKIERIIYLKGNPVSGQEVQLGLKLLYLHNLADLRYTFSGPKHILSLPNLSELEIEGCGKLKFIFSTTVLRSLPQLQKLVIANCDALQQIVEEDYEKQSLPNPHNIQVYFPMLESVHVINCRELKRLFWMNKSCYEFPKLETLFILEAPNLEEVFGRSKKGETEKQEENVLPDLKYLFLAELPSLASLCQWSRLQHVQKVYVLNCPKLSMTSSTLQELIETYEKKLESGRSQDNRFGDCWLIDLALKELNRLKIREGVKSEAEAASKRELHSSQSIKETEKDIVGEVCAPEISPATSSSTDMEVIKMPTTSTSAAQLSETTLLGQPGSVGETKGLVKEGLNEPVSTKALGKCKSTNETPQILDQNSGLAQKTSLQNNAETVEQIVQEPKNPSPAPLQKESDQSIEGSVQKNPVLQKANMVTFATNYYEKSPEILEETNETPQRFDKPSDVRQKTSLQSTDGNAERGSEDNMVTSTNSEPGSSINSQPEFDGNESMGALISVEQGALNENKINHEFPQIVAKPSDSGHVQNVEEHENVTTFETISSKTARSLNISESDSKLTTSVTSLQKTSPLDFVEKGSNEPVSHDSLEENKTANETGERLQKSSETSLQASMRVSKTEAYIDKDTNASCSNLQDLMDGVFSVLNSMEKESEVQKSMPSASEIPSDCINLDDHELLAKAFADLEAYLKMPLKDLASSEVSSHYFENTLRFLSSWSCGNGAPLEGLKAKIDSLLQNMPTILSSFKNASAAINKFTVFDKRLKYIKEELPQRKEAANILRKSIAEAQQKEAASREKLYRLQAELKSTENEIKEHDVHLLSLEEQGKKFNIDTIDLLKEFETIKKGKSEMVEDPRKAQQELFKASYEWQDLCNQLMQSCNVAWNLF